MLTTHTGNRQNHGEIQNGAVVFIDDGNLSQMILSAENEEIAEVPGKMLVDGLIGILLCLWSGVSERVHCPFIFFLQDIQIEKPDTPGPVKNRPTRYKTFISRLQKPLY